MKSEKVKIDKLLSKLVDFCERAIKKIFSYSIFQFLFNFTNYFSRNLDKLIIGRYFSMEELGYYEKSYRLMTLPLQYVTNVITPVMHPILTSLQNDYKDLPPYPLRVLPPQRGAEAKRVILKQIDC